MVDTHPFDIHKEETLECFVSFTVRVRERIHRCIALRWQLGVKEEIRSRFPRPHDRRPSPASLLPACAPYEMERREAAIEADQGRAEAELDRTGACPDRRSWHRANAPELCVRSICDPDPSSDLQLHDCRRHPQGRPSTMGGFTYTGFSSISGD